jgi:hypothetical protein
MDHATRVSIQLLDVNAHTITRSKFISFKETLGDEDITVSDMTTIAFFYYKVN